MVITGEASASKVQDIETRLKFLVDHLEDTYDIRRKHHPSPLTYLLSSGVASADPSAISAFARRRLRWVVDLDYDTNPMDAWDLIDLGAAVSHRPNKSTLAAAYHAFAQHVGRLTASGPRPAYLFGTGPSLRLAIDRSFQDGITIVCNTIVRDAELWHHLSPSFLAAGDGVYHFGHNPHARQFRADAHRRLRESNGDTLFVYPYQFDVIVRAEFQDIEHLLVPIPRGEHTDATIDLIRNFSIPPLGNVLCDELLPLGCTVSKDVRLWGFDGRAPNDDGFWANSNRQSYPELMQSMRELHPAFFANAVPTGNEVRYVTEVHGDRLDERLTEAEGRGYTFRMLHPSWTPTFQKRFHGTDPDRA